MLGAFDMLELNGEDLRRKALGSRKAILVKSLGLKVKNPKAPAVRREAEEDWAAPLKQRLDSPIAQRI